MDFLNDELFRATTSWAAKCLWPKLDPDGDTDTKSKIVWSKSNKKLCDKKVYVYEKTTKEKINSIYHWIYIKKQKKMGLVSATSL